MARPKKPGLEYFPVDVDIFDDPKLLFVAEKHGSIGELMTIKLLCWIYRNGYYCEWDEETAMIFARKNFSTVKSEDCQIIIQELIRRSFFSKRMFEDYGILTSKAIQERWQAVIDKSKRKSEIKTRFSLLFQEETPAKTELTKLEKEETSTKKELSTQSKEKETKVYHIKQKGKKIESQLLSEINISDVPADLSDYYKWALKFQGLFISNLEESNSPATHQKRAKFKAYVDPIRLMFEKDEVTDKNLDDAYNFLKVDKFWKSNILSTQKLRDKLPKLIISHNSNKNARNSDQRNVEPTINRQTASTIESNSRGW